MTEQPTPLPPARITSSDDASPRSLTQIRRRRAIAAVLALVLVAGVVWGVALVQERNRPDADRYSTVLAERGSVTQRLSASGTVEKVNESSVGFPTAGTVTEVRVSAGDTVRAGDVLAVMDDEALRTKVLQAQASVDAAALALQQVRDAEDAATSAGTSASGSTGPTGSGATANPMDAVPPLPAPTFDLTPLEATLGEAGAAEAEATARQAEAEAALVAMRRACQPAETPRPTVTPTPTAQPTSSPTPTEPSVAPTVAPASETACGEAQAAVSTAQAAVAAAQERVTASHAQGLALLQAGAASLTDWVGQVQQWAAAVLQAAAQSGAPVGIPTGTHPGAGDVTGPDRSTTVGAEVTLAKARRDLAQAREDLAAATLRAPIDGQVTALPFTTGGTTTGTERATITAPGAVRVSLTIPASSFPYIRTGQQATLRGAGGATITARVEGKTLVPNEAGTYPVTVVTGADGADAFAAGTSATIDIEMSSATDVVVVPMTAVVRTGSTGTVKVMKDSQVVEVPVTLGSVGDTRIEVVEGVESGDRLVVADANEPIPNPFLG